LAQAKAQGPVHSTPRQMDATAMSTSAAAASAHAQMSMLIKVLAEALGGDKARGRLLAGLARVLEGRSAVEEEEPVLDPEIAELETPALEIPRQKTGKGGENIGAPNGSFIFLVSDYQ